MSDVTNVTDVADVADVVSRVVDELDRFKKSKMNREPVYKPKGRKLKHSEVPEYIYSHIQPVDFRSEAGLMEDKDKLNIRHFLFTCIEKIRETVDETGLLVLRWSCICTTESTGKDSIPSFQSFLGKSAVKMGVTKFLGRIYSFKEQRQSGLCRWHILMGDDDADSCEGGDQRAARREVPICD